MGTVVGVCARASDGDTADLCDLWEYILDTDADMQSFYETRVARVAQADWIIAPNPFGDRALAKIAAQFVDAQFSRIESLHQVFRNAMNAVFIGFNAGENEWANDGRDNYIRRINFRHGHRFRWDEQWQLRLHDRGERKSADSRFGEELDPRLWTIHQHQAKPAYPGAGGLARSLLMLWMFGRWADTWQIQSIEKYGGPFLYCKVPPNTPEPVRRDLLAMLNDMANEHVGVFEKDNEIVVEVSAQSARSHEALRDYKKENTQAKARAILGVGDAVDAGANGSQAAVGTRVGAALDPRMVVDGLMVGDGFHLTTFRQIIEMNPHRWAALGVTPEQVPVPVMRLRTADDEVRRDHSDLEAELAAVGKPIDVRGSDGPLPDQSTEGDLQKQALNGAQTASALEIATAANAGTISREQAISLLTVAFPSMSPSDANQIAGSGPPTTSADPASAEQVAT